MQLPLGIDTSQEIGKARIGVICATCGKVIDRIIYGVPKSGKNYCSSKCRTTGCSIIMSMKGVGYGKSNYDIDLSLFSTRPPDNCIKEFKIDSCLNCPLPDCER